MNTLRKFACLTLVSLLLSSCFKEDSTDNVQINLPVAYSAIGLDRITVLNFPLTNNAGQDWDQGESMETPGADISIVIRNASGAVYGGGDANSNDTDLPTEFPLDVPNSGSNPLDMHTQYFIDIYDRDMFGSELELIGTVSFTPHEFPAPASASNMQFNNVEYSSNGCTIQMHGFFIQ